MRRVFLVLSIILISLGARASQVLVPMDEQQTNHLKSYGLAYWVLQKGIEVNWLLNYRGGSFMMADEGFIESECRIRGIKYEVISEGEAGAIVAEIGREDANMDVMKLEKVPKIAVYSPKSKQPWDDAVTLVLTYAEIPYDIVFDDEVLEDKLAKYDWLHLHHEDFTGQYGRFFSSFGFAPWYRDQVKEAEEIAKRHGLAKYLN